MPGPNTQRTQILDKNGKLTHVHKNPQGVSKVHSALPDIAKSFSAYSGYEVLADPKIELQDGHEYQFTSGDGIGRDSSIFEAEIIRNDDDGEVKYTLTGKSHYQNLKHWLAWQMSAEEDSDDFYDLMERNTDLIERFLLRDYDADEVYWNEGEFQLIWYADSSEGFSISDAHDIWEENDSTRFYNESDPGTYGVRNLWSDLAREVEAAEEVRKYTDEKFFDATTDNISGLYAANQLRALAFDKRIQGDSGVQIVAQRSIVSNEQSPWDAVYEVASKSSDESVQLLAVESAKLPDAQLGKLRDSTRHESVRDAIDDIINARLLNNFTP